MKAMIQVRGAASPRRLIVLCMGPVGRLTQVTFECADPPALAEFWRAVLQLEPATGDENRQTLEWEPVERLTFHRVEGYRPPEWPGLFGEQQSHFDLLVTDFADACARVEDAGGRALSPVLEPGPQAWRIYADPEGHPFCLVSTPE